MQKKSWQPHSVFARVPNYKHTCMRSRTCWELSLNWIQYLSSLVFPLVQIDSLQLSDLLLCPLHLTLTFLSTIIDYWFVMIGNNHWLNKDVIRVSVTGELQLVVVNQLTDPTLGELQQCQQQAGLWLDRAAGRWIWLVVGQWWFCPVTGALCVELWLVRGWRSGCRLVWNLKTLTAFTGSHRKTSCWIRSRFKWFSWCSNAEQGHD